MRRLMSTATFQLQTSPERFNILLTAIATSNHRQWLDYVLEPWTPSWALSIFMNIMPMLSCEFSRLLFAQVRFLSSSLLIVGFGV